MRALITLLALIPTISGAEIIYSNGGPLDGGETVASDLDNLGDPDPSFCQFVRCFAESADNFTLSASTTVNGINWWGVYTPNNQFDAVPDDFTVRFLDDSFGLISSISLDEVFRIDTGLTAGQISPPRSIFAYQAAFSQISFAPGNYYISIVNNTAGDAAGQRWSWQSTADITGTAALGRGSNDPFTDFQSGWSPIGGGDGIFDLAFELTRNVTPVPEPSTFALFLGGLLGLVLRRRKADRFYVFRQAGLCASGSNCESF